MIVADAFLCLRLFFRKTAMSRIVQEFLDKHHKKIFWTYYAKKSKKYSFL